jgi:threonine dehydratase
MVVIPGKEAIIQAAERIKPFVHCTPVLQSTSINQLCEAQVFLKCENFQRMGAFKMRGATNAILQLTDEKRNKGVVTHSSGNFAQALSLAAQSLKTNAFIVMPDNAPAVKVAAVKGYGADIIMCESTLEARERTSLEIQKKTGATFIHPSNDMNVILGQGTAAVELINEVGILDVLITPVGGGGLLAGTALAVHHYLPDAETIAGEPYGADDAYHSLKTGQIQPCINPNTIADGLKTQLGDQNFPIIRQLVRQIIRVEESEIVEAMRYIWERMKIIIEPSSAVAVAALFRQKEEFKNMKVGIIISGGNVDLENLPF